MTYEEAKKKGLKIINRGNGTATVVCGNFGIIVTIPKK